MSPTVLESKKAISWHRVWRKRLARILKRFQCWAQCSLAQPDQPPLFHDGVHEDVAGVEEGGAELCQEKAAEGFFLKKEQQEILHLRMRTVLALVLSMQLRREESQRREGRARSRRLVGVVEWRLVRAWPASDLGGREGRWMEQQPVSISE